MKSLLKKIAKNSVASIAYAIADEWVKGQLQLTPVLAEFPKSGGSIVFTILNFIVAKSSKLCDPVPHIYSCTNYGVDLDRAQTSLALASSLHARVYAPLGVVKTHSRFRNDFRYVICLYREPLAVMRSYYRYLLRGGNSDYRDLSALIECKKLGIESWIDFHESYLAASTNSHIFFCRFEAFTASPAQFFNDILISVYGLELKPEAHAIVERISKIHYGQYYENLVIQHDPRKRYSERFIGSRARIPCQNADIPEALRIRCENVLSALAVEAQANK